MMTTTSIPNAETPDVIEGGVPIGNGTAWDVH